MGPARRSLTQGAALLLALGLLTAGCGRRPLYRWGVYEDLLYASWVRPGSADPLTQIAALRRDVEVAAAEGGHVPPGVWAHLGYLYWLEGDLEAARDAFARERALFPESAVFIDGMLRRMDAS